MKNKNEDLIFLDPISEAHLYFGHPNFSETSFMTLMLKGKVNKKIFKQTFHDFVVKYPRFHSILVERKRGLFYKLYRKPIDSYPEIIEINLLDKTLSNREKILNYFSKKIKKEFDLFKKVPFHAYLCDLGGDYHAIVFVSHHVLIDGQGIATFLMKFFLIYYEKIHQKKLSLDGVLGLFSSRRVGAETELSRAYIIKTLLSTKSIGLVIKLFALNKARLFKMKYPVRKKRYMERIVFSKEIQENLRSFARSKGASINDLLIAILFRSLDSMFPSKKKGKDLFTISGPVNIYGKLPIDENRGNNITSIVYGSYSSHRKNIDNLLKLVRESRKRQIEANVDMVQYYFLRLLIKFTQLFPYRLRIKMFKNIFQQPSTSMLSNLGILWPEVKKGRPTGKSMVIKIAEDLELVDLDFNYPGIPRLGHGLASFTYQEKLYLNLTFSGAFFTENSVSQFINAIHKEVNNLI